MKEWIIPDEFLDYETKESAEAQGFLDELVRCKDCRYHSDEKIMGYKVCTKWNKHLSYFSTADDWYCGYGERRSDDA